MNLAIEYLIRTRVIENFLSFPCSLCVENCLGSKTVVGLERGDEDVVVTHWHLDQKGERLPPSSTYQVNPKDTFTSDKVVLPNSILFPYTENEIRSAYNKYGHPMSRRVHDMFVNYFLNSAEHIHSREQWLWSPFVQVHVGEKLLNELYYAIAPPSQCIQLEQEVLKEQHQEKWMIWCSWKRKLLKDTSVATELVFSPAYGG